MRMQTASLRINHRNILRYYQWYKKTNPGSNCYAPPVTVIGCKAPDYPKALEYLDKHGWIKLDKTDKHYTSWIIQDP